MASNLSSSEIDALLILCHPLSAEHVATLQNMSPIQHRLHFLTWRDLFLRLHLTNSKHLERHSEDV